MRLKRTSLAAGVVFALVVSGLAPSMRDSGKSGLGGGLIVAEGQNLGQRVVMGAVEDSSSVPVVGATVFLKDLKSKSIRSYTSIAKGEFRFAQVNMAEDHELWAEKDGRKSAVKTVSSWDTRQEFQVDLKLK